MKGIIEVFGGHDIGPWLKSLSAVEIAALDGLIIEKNERVYFKCPVRKKDILAKPEECVRQFWLHTLQAKYGYPLERLAVEYPITFGRDSSKRADIVIFDEHRPTVPYIVAEIKQGKAKDGKEQLRSYTHATGAPLALWSNGPDSKIWNRKNPNYLQEIPHLPTATQDIEDIINEPWTLKTLEDKENERALSSAGNKALREKIVDLEDEVLANAGVDVFEEVFKLVFTKLYDEMSCHQGRYPYLRFRNSTTAAKVKDNIQNLFDAAKDEWPGVFSEDERIKLSPDHLQVCVGSLEEWWSSPGLMDSYGLDISSRSRASFS
ncbi:MAG: type I restriction enzyme HsdR N-terminal domain-containing protein [Marinibacterium sp.]